MDEGQNGLAEFTDIRYLDPRDIKLNKTAGGFISLDIGNSESYERVNLFRSFPFSNINEYISVREPEGKEIGIIRTILSFSKEAKAIIIEELDRRYFLPKIEKINTIKEEFGYIYLDTNTDAGPRHFTIKKEQNSVINIEDNKVLLFDIDGNRFEIPDYTMLDSKSYKMIELLI